MIKGMTGFGQAQLTTGALKALVEIKSVNHRYLDISYYLPAGFGSLESKIRQMIQREIHRGRVTASLKIIEREAQKAVFNKNIAKMHLLHIRRLKAEFGIKGDLTLSDFVKLPGVLDAKETTVIPDALWPSLEKCFKRAVKDLARMRASEGRSLTADVTDKLKLMFLQINKIQKQVRLILSQKKKDLTHEDFRSFQKSTDISEEITRMLHYIDEVKPLLRGSASVGKKIDFIAQEMQRETNTIGSKLQDRMVSNAVIALKSKIEKIREQAQNIE